MSPSYQLPDLLSLCRPFELRTNRACRSVTLASQTWLLSLKKGSEPHDVLTKAESTNLSSAKIGLLAALCFPACDPPQLRLLTDFLTLVILADGRMGRVCKSTNPGWSNDDETEFKNGLDILEHHALFQYVIPQMKRLVPKAHENWVPRFTSSVRSYRSAQLQANSNRPSDAIPDLESYMNHHRDLCGVTLVLELLELTEIAAFSALNPTLSEKMETLKQLTADIIACSLDIASFNRDQAQGNSHNLITVLVTHKGLSIQGALNFAGSLIKDLFAAFLATEQALLDLDRPTPPQTNHSRPATLSSYSWSWSPFTRTSAPSSPPMPENLTVEANATLSDLHSSIKALKDCIVGLTNWIYETELYFGKKGEEIRAFGWVFLNPKIDNPDDEM